MPIVINFLLRVVLAAAALVFAASVAVVFTLVVALWLLRAGWARLTGRPVTPFVFRSRARRSFEDMVRRAQASQASRTPRADAAGGPRARLADVTDVQPK